MQKNIFVQCVTIFLIVFLVDGPLYAQQSGSINRDTSLIQRTTNPQQGNYDVRSLNVKTDSQQVLPINSAQISDMSSALMQAISVHVLGDVADPGVIKVKVSDRAADVLKLAVPNRSTVRSFQIRHPEEDTRYFDLYQYYYFGNLNHNPYLKENDTIFVPQSKGAVRIEGPVARPGVFELGSEKYLSQIVRLAGGFTASLSKMQPIKVIRFSDESEKFVLDVVQTEESLKKFEIKKGDVIAVPDVVNANNKFDYSLEVIPGENSVYPTSVPDVFVVGAVTQPGPYPYKSHLTIKDYVGFAGASADASFRSVSIMRDGKKKSYRLHDKMQAGDVLIVKQKSRSQMVTYVSIASALLSVAMTAVLINEYTKN